MRKYRVLFLIFFIGLSLVARSFPDNGPDTEDKDGNSGGKMDSQTLLSHTPRFTLKITAGIGFPGMSKPMGAVPAYSPAQTVGIDDYNQNYSGSLNRLIGSGVSVGLGYEFLRARGRGVTVEYRALSTSPFVIDFQTHGAFALVNKSWQVSKKPLAVEVHVAIQGGHYWSSHQYTFAEHLSYILVGYSIQVPETWKSWQDSSWGIEPIGGFSWLVTRHFVVGMDGGYRWLQFETPGSPAPKTDFSGPTVRLQIGAKF
jgi:hypothetical protein